MWESIAQTQQRELIQALLHGDASNLRSSLSSPHNNYLLYGFENVYLGSSEPYRANPALAQAFAERCHDVLVRLAEALGVLRVENADAPAAWGHNLALAADEVLDAIEDELGIDVAPPCVFSEMWGLQTRRGIVTERMLSGLYVAWRLRSLLHQNVDRAVLEIGAGLGWLAYYAHRLGIEDYTIVDLPLTNVAQALFLGTALGPRSVALAGEERGPAQIRIGTAEILDDARRYALIVNVDSLTEIGTDAARDLWTRAARTAAAFLSINHEANTFTTRELVLAVGKARLAHRHPHWLRNGYVEELFELNPP